MVKSNIIVACACILLTACGTIQTKTMVTAECPEPPKTERPELEVLKLKFGDDAATVMQAHRADIKACQGYAVELETLLNAYRKDKQVVKPVDVLPESEAATTKPVSTIKPAPTGVVSKGNPLGKTPPPKRRTR